MAALLLRIEQTDAHILLDDFCAEIERDTDVFGSAQLMKIVHYKEVQGVGE